MEGSTRLRAEPTPSSTPAVSVSSSGEWERIGDGFEYGAVDLGVPGVPPDPTALLAYVDHDHGEASPSPVRKAKPSRPRKAKSAKKKPAKAAAPTPASTATATATATPAALATTAQGVPPDFYEKLAAMKASAFNAALMVHAKNGDRNSKYEMMHVLESADDALTRKKMKEQFAAQNTGSLTDFIGKQKWDGAHGKDQALDLMSEKRDVATNNLAAMSPDKRADLEDKAAGWADKILNVTRGSDRDDSENADKIAAILGPCSPEELEVIRKRIRLQTSGTKSTTVYEELDRTFTDRDESIAMSGLSGDRVKVAQTQLVDAAAEGDPERIHAIAKQLGPESMWKLNASDPLLAGRVIAAMPEDRRKEFSALMNGKQDAAEGARIAAMLQPVDMSGLSAADAMSGTAVKKLKQKEAQDPERVIAELSKSSPEELKAARKAYEESGNGKSWDELISTTFKDADPTVRMRIEAAASGDVVGEKALRLRQGMRKFDQNLIDGALANPDLQSPDAKKRAAAQAERRQLEQRLQQFDANEQRTMALMEGKSTEGVQGRGVDDQLSAYYERRREHDTGSGAGGPFGMVRDIAEKDSRMAAIREQAAVDRYAAKEMWHEGEAQLSTKVRRAEMSGDTAKKAELLENAKKGTISTHDADYKRKFGNDRGMLEGPDLSEAKGVAKIFARMTGDDRPPEEIAAELVRDNMNVAELRMQHVRETGALADRTRDQRIAQQTELRDLSESGWLAGDEQMRFAMGFGNRGSEDLHASSIALLQQSGGSDVDDREFQRRDTSTTKALELQREEKQKAAARVAQALSLAGKIAALLTANPAFFVAVDAGFSVARIAAQELIANEAYDATNDIKHMAVDMAVNIATARLATLGKGLEAGSQAAKSAQTLQRIGNAGAAMGGAAAHSMIDGDDAGGAVVRAGVGALVPGLLRGKAENLVKGTSRGANFVREGLGTVVDTASNVVIGGGHIDAGTAIDVIGGTVQGQRHGDSKATAHDHAAMTTHQVADIDLPRRSGGSSDDAIRRTNRSDVDPPRSQRTRIEDHAREVEARRRAETATQAHAHVLDDPSIEVPRQAAAASSAPGPGPTRSDTTVSSDGTVGPRLPAESAVASSARTTQPMEAVVPPSERITERMAAVRADEGPDAAALARAWERSTEAERDRPASYTEAIDRSTGVDKGAEYEQFRRDMAEMYANQEIEAQNVTRIQGRPTEAKKDGTYYVGNTDYDVRRFSYDNAVLTSVTLDAHLRPGAGISADDVAAVKRSSYQGVDQIMNRDAEGKRHVLPDGSKLQVEPTFHDDAASANHVVDLVQPFDERGKRLRSNQARWALPDVLNPAGAAHELVGHGLGFPDRYVDPDTWFRDHPNSPFVTHDGNFMETVGPGASLKQHQLDQLGRDIAAAERAKGHSGSPVDLAQKISPTDADPAQMPLRSSATDADPTAFEGMSVQRTDNKQVDPGKVRNVIANEAALIAPHGGEVVDLHTIKLHAAEGAARDVRIEVGETGGKPSQIAVDENGAVRLVVSSSLPDEHLTRAVAHGMAMAERSVAAASGQDMSLRPPAEIEGRAAELRVVLAQLDRTGTRGGESARPDVHSSDVNQILGSLGINNTPEGRAAIDATLGFDPELARRAKLHLAGYAPRPAITKNTNLEDFTKQRTDRSEQLSLLGDSQGAQSLRAVDDLAMGAQLRLEEGHRVFDGSISAAKYGHPQFDTVDSHRRGMLATMNDPTITPSQKRQRLLHQIDEMSRDPALAEVVGKMDVASMRANAEKYGDGTDDRGAMSLDVATGRLKMPGDGPEDSSSIRDVMGQVDRANEEARKNGLGVNYVLVIHEPSQTEGGSKLAHVEVLARPMPRSHLGQSSGERIPDTGAKGDLIVDVGVGMGGFAVENATRPDGVMIVQTEHINSAQIGQISRSAPGVSVPGPVSSAGSVVIFADVLKHPELLGGTGPNQGVKQVFINNVSAHYGQEDYQQMASGLATNLPRGATVEIQFTREPEEGAGKGIEGNRGHIEPDPLLLALRATGRKVSAKPAPTIEGRYTIDAATRPAVDADSAAKFAPPIPQKRWIITFEDDPNSEQSTDDHDK